MVKVGILTNIPSPYRRSMWNSYSELSGITIDVYYCSQRESDRRWRVGEPKSFTGNIEEIFLKGITFFRYFHINPGIIKLAKNYDIWVIGGYSTPSAILLILLCLILNKPYVIVFDGINPKKLKENENPLKFLLKKLLVRKCSAFFANGQVGRLYGLKLGVSEEKIYNQYLSVDLKKFMVGLPSKKAVRNKIREDYRIPADAFLILFIGRLIKKKGVLDLIEAFNNLSSKNPDYYLMIIGDGALRGNVQTLANANEKLKYIGFIDYDEIWKYYYASDVFVLPTYDDPWGLVINEALACGLPTVTTTSAGAYLDLVEDGVTGFLYDAGDKAKLTDLLLKVRQYDMQLFYENAIKTISSWSLDNSKASFAKMIKKIVEERHIA
jgi:glycosyltransferase involved in cell wall biosynthesis